MCGVESTAKAADIGFGGEKRSQFLLFLTLCFQCLKRFMHKQRKVLFHLFWEREDDKSCFGFRAFNFQRASAL